MLGREREDARRSGMFYTAVVQAVFLYRSEYWVMSLQIDNVLSGFYHQVIWWLTGQMLHQNWDGTRK